MVTPSPPGDAILESPNHPDTFLRTPRCMRRIVMSISRVLALATMMIVTFAWNAPSPVWAWALDDPPAKEQVESPRNPDHPAPASPQEDEHKVDTPDAQADETTDTSSKTARQAGTRPNPPKRRAAGGIETQLGAALNDLGLGRVAQGAVVNSRQVTLFAIVADPHDRSIDPKLREIEPLLSRSLPHHGFRLIDARTLRLKPGEAIHCGLTAEARTMLSQPMLPEGWPPMPATATPVVARAELVSAWTNRGKVEFRLALLGADGAPQVASLVSTPPNQLFFVNNPLPNGGRLLIGLGAR